MVSTVPLLIWGTPLASGEVVATLRITTSESKPASSAWGTHLAVSSRCPGLWSLQPFSSGRSTATLPTPHYSCFHQQPIHFVRTMLYGITNPFDQSSLRSESRLQRSMYEPFRTTDSRVSPPYLLTCLLRYSKISPVCFAGSEWSRYSATAPALYLPGISTPFHQSNK